MLTHNMYRMHEVEGVSGNPTDKPILRDSKGQQSGDWKEWYNKYY